MDTLTPLLIDAKREYVGQLTDVLAPYVVAHIGNLWGASQAQGRAALLTFQNALREIQLWNADAVARQTAHIQNKYSFLGDLIAAVFVAYVKILSSVKLHHQKPNIRLKLPANDTFVHRVFVHAAREFYADPSLVRADRARKLAVVRAAVEASVRDMLPIEDILKAYLGNTVDDHAVNPASFGDDQLASLVVNPASPAPPVFAAPAFGPPPAQTFAAPPVGAPPAQTFGAPPAPAYPQPGAPPAPAYPQPPQQPQQYTQPPQQYTQPPQQQPSEGSFDADDEPKQISLGASQPPLGVTPRSPSQRAADDLFSDAEDDF